MRYTWLVEKYLEGELSGEALRNLELDILRKPEVAEEVERIRNLTAFSREQHLKMQNTIGLFEDFDDIENVININDMREELESLKIRKISSTRIGMEEIENRITELQAEDMLSRQHSNKVLVKKVSLWLAGSAMAIFIAVSLLLLIGTGQTDYQELYSEYYHPRPADVPRTVSPVQKTPVSEAMEFYRQGQYARSYQLFNKIPRDEMSKENFFYMGVSAMETGEFAKAVTLFNVLDEDDVWKHEGMWYKSLCYLAMEDPKSIQFALDEIIQSNGYYKTSALSLLRKL